MFGQNLAKVEVMQCYKPKKKFAFNLPTFLLQDLCVCWFLFLYLQAVNQSCYMTALVGHKTMKTYEKHMFPEDAVVGFVEADRGMEHYCTRR